MKIYVLYDRSGIHSGRALGEDLGKVLGAKATVDHGRPERLQLLLRQGKKYDYVVNVGWFKSFSAGTAVILNPPGEIARSSNKRGARITFRDSGVPAPKLWLTPGDIGNNEFPVIGRTTHHTKGKGLWLCNNPREAEKSRDSHRKQVKKLITTRKGNKVWRVRGEETDGGATHFLKFIPNTREFRVHVMAPRVKLEGLTPDEYRVIKLSEKQPDPDARTDAVVKSHDNGWVFSYPKNKKEPILSQVRETAKKALSVFGLHWGAVDIMVSKDTGKTYVLEINSTPCLTDDNSNTLEKYSKSIAQLVGTTGAVATPKSGIVRKKAEVRPVKRSISSRRQAFKSALNKASL